MYIKLPIFETDDSNYPSNRQPDSSECWGIQILHGWTNHMYAAICCPDDQTTIVTLYHVNRQGQENVQQQTINYSDKFVKQQAITAFISVAQLCTGKNVCPPKWRTFSDDVMSPSELTTL